MTSSKTQLYRHFDKHGRLLYVGVSVHFLSRLSAHKAASRWFEDIARVDVQQFSTREEALIAEREAIAKEKPLYNLAGAAWDEKVIDLSPNRGAYTIPEFCELHGFSRQHYYNMRPEDRPDEMRIGKLVRISHEAVARWRAQMESKAKRASGLR